MGALFSNPTPPSLPVPPPPITQPATMADPTLAANAQAASKKAAAAVGAGYSGTIGTTPEGLKAPPMTTDATLLGGTK